MAPDHGFCMDGQGPPAPAEPTVECGAPGWKALPEPWELHWWLPLPARLLRRSEGALWEEPQTPESLVGVLCCCCCLAGGRLDEAERPPAGCLSLDASRAVGVEEGRWSMVISSRIRAERTCDAPGF
jgi:hypothetical protein